MKYPATWEEYKAQKQNRKAAGDSTAASGSSPLPATWEEYKAQKQAKAQQLPATQTDTAEREKCLNASGFKAMQTDIQGLFGTMDGYFSTYHKIGASSKWQKDQVSKMLQNVAQEKDYFNRYADVMGEDAQSYQKQLNAWEAQLKRYQKAMNGQEDDEGSLALGSGIARFQTEADAYFKKAQETTAGMSEPERANQWVSGAQTLLTEAQEIEAYLKKKNTPAAQTLMTQMAEYRKALEDMQTSARGAQLTNPLTGKAMPDVAISGRMRLPRYTADGKVQTGYGSAYDRRLGQQEERTLAAGMERKAEKADWQNQTVQQHEDYIRQDFEELKEYTSANTSSSQVENIHAGIFTEIAERLNYLALSGKCTGSEYEALLDKVEQWKNEYLAHAENVRKEKNNRAGNITHGELYWKDGKIVKYREAGYDKDTAAIDKIRSEAKSLLPSKGDAMKEFRYQSGNLTRENIAYTPVDELLGKMGFDHGGTDWGTSDAERRAVTFLSEEVLPEYLANTEMTQEQYDAFMQKIADAPNAAELRATREANGLNANEAGMQSALEMYRKIDAKTYADMAGTGAVNAMENVMTKYAGGMEQVLMRGLGYLTKAVGKTLNLFGLAENPVGNYFVEGGQQGIDYENKDWQEGKQREYEAGRYASELTQNGSKFTKFTANMTRDLTQAALEMAAAGAIAGQISAGNTALSQLSQGGKYASSLANAQKRVSGYTKFAGQMANLMKNSSNVLISANAALNSYGEAEDAGRSMPERAVKLIAGGLIEYGTNGLFGGNPIVDPENAGLISKYITDLTDNETIRKIVSSKVFDRIGEGMEEVASAVAGAALDYALTGETDLTAKELVDEFTVGVLLSMVMSAPEDIVDLTARAKSYVQSKVITRFGKQAQSNLDVLYGTMAQYTAQYYAGDENLMRFNGWSESQIKKAKGEWNTIVREFNTLADRLESAQNISESFERYTPPQANGGFVDVEMQNIIRAEQQSNAALMTDRALDIQIITQRATIEALRGSTDATDIFMAESAQSYLDVLDAEKSARAAERAQRAAESAAQENIPTAEQTAQETPQAAQETAQSAAATVEQEEEINAPAAQETEGGMSNEQSQSVNENQERNERVGAEGQTGGVVESGSRITADRGGTGEGGGNESENLRRQKLNERVERFKGTVLDTGMDKLTADGDPDVMVGIVPVRKYTQAMKQAQREAKEQGVKTTFVVGTMSIKGEDGEYHNTDAMFDAESGRIFVSVSSIYEPEVLMEHELFHAKVHAAEIDLVTALESVSENMTAEEYTEIVEQYMKAYRGAYDSDTAVYEEILADAYAGLNRFANRSFKKLIDAMRTHAAGMQSQRESNAPTAEVSQAVRRTQDSDGNEKTAREGGKRASMAGPKAKTASSKNLALAEAMEEDGASREEIWRKTGWIRGADGQWRFEVDDSKAEFRPNGDERLLTEDSEAPKYELEPYSEREAKNWEASPKILLYKNENQLMEFVDEALQNDRDNRKIYFGKISEDLGGKILKETGVNVKGFNCTLAAYEVRKILKRHGSDKTEKLQGQTAITKEDFLKIPKIIQNADKIELSEKPYNGKPVIVFSKKTDRKVVVVTYASDKHLDLRIQTMYAGKKSGNLATPTDVQASVITPEAARGTVPTSQRIASRSQNVKRENENLTTIRNLNEDDLAAMYGSARIPVQELLANTEGAGDVSLIVKNEDTRNNNAHLENMAAVIPSSVDWWLVERLKMNGLNVVEYRAGNEQARQGAEAEAEKLLEPKKRFSLSPEEKVQRAENKLTAAQEKLEQEKEKAQERYKRDLTSGMRRLFNIQSYDSKELNGLLETPMLEMQQGVKLLKAEKDDLFEALMNLGTETMPADDYYREIRDTIYGQKVFVPERVRTEFGDDWNSFKKRAMGRHKFYFVEDEGKQGIDQLYKELAEQYPGAFPDTYDMTEMLRRMEDMADKGMDTKLPYRQAMEENEKRFGMTVDEQTEYQRTTFERLLNSYAEKAGRDARIAQDKAAKAEADERLESILREADGVQPTKKAEGVVEPWTISEAAAQKRGFPYLNGKQVYPLRTWVKAADMGNYGLVLDKSTKKGMLTVLFTNKETGLASVKDMETKLLTAVEPKYQPSVQETAALLASMPQEKLEDAADAEDLGAFYEWYDGQTEGRETNDLRPVAEERAEKSRQAAQEIEKQRGESALEKQEAYEQKKAERIEGIRKAYLESFGTTEPKLPYGKDRPMQSRFTTLQPGEALSLLQAMTGTKWALTNNADGTWKATMTKDPAPKTSISPKEALERLEAAKKTYGQQIPGVHPEGIAKENFKGSPALEKAGVKIDGGIADYGQVETMRKGAETRRSVKWQIDKTIQRMEATKQEIRAAKKIAQGKQEYYRLPDKCRPEVVSQLSGLYLNERMTGEDLIQVRKSEIRDGLFYKMMELFPTENEIMANPELFKAEKLLVLNYRTALRSMVNIFGEERGMEIYNYLFAPVIRNTAESYRWTNQQFDDVKEFTDSSGKKSRLNETERAYVHMMLDVEGYVEKAERSDRGDILKDAAKKVAKGESISNETIEFALNSEEAKIVEKYAQWINGKDAEGIDKVKCENAMKEYRGKFDLYFEAINDFLVAHGMQPIGRIQGYTPHMPLAEKFNLMSKALEVLGLNETVTTLPAEISGRTEGFRPQRRWNPFLLERKTDKTAYDIEEAFQSYVQYLSDILFHTDDIQKVRAAERYLRKGLRGNFVDDLQKAIDMSRSSDAEEKIEYLQEMGQIGADDYDLSDAEMMQVFDRLISELVGEETNKTRYSPLVVWLKNYGDILAGKQFGGDRGTEYGGGREWLNIGNKLVGAFAKANVAGNLSSVLNQSAQLAMLQATRSQRAILKATQEFCTGKLGEFRKEIDFLTGKKGIDYLVQSGTDKFISGMFAPAEFMDSMLSTIATRAAYWDAIRNGKSHEEAMRFADWYGRALMGDRTKGAKPLKFHSKGVVVQMLNVFQIEPLNTVEFVMQDMPLEIKREAREHGKKSAARMLLRTIFGYLIAAFVLNRLTDELYGGTPAPLDIAGLTANFFASGKGLPTNDYIKNLINKVVGSEIFDVQEPKEGFDTSAAIKDTGYNLMNEIPFASNASGLLGVGDRTMPFPNIFRTGKNFYDALFPGSGKSANGQEVLEKGLEFLAELVPGGRQAKKTGYGIKAIAQGGKTKGYGDNERLLYALDTDNVWNDIRTVLFGTNATPEANRYYAGDSYGLNADQTKLWKELRDEGVNGYMLYGLMMRMDDAMNYSDIPEPKDDESEEEKAKRLQQKEEHRKKARAELAAQEGLTDGQRMRIYSAMVESGKNDAIDKLLDAGMKWKEISEILDKRGELKAGKTESEWAAEFASWLDGKKYSGKNREAINEALVPQSASFYNKMTAAGVGKNSAIKIEEIARKAAKADGKNFSEAYQARAVAQAGLSENEAYKALCAIYSDGTAEKFKEAHEAGIPAKEYTKFWLAQAELESDRDEDGEFISGSKREKVIELIDSLNLTAEQKDWIMSQKYKSYDWWMMPWS